MVSFSRVALLSFGILAGQAVAAPSAAQVGSLESSEVATLGGEAVASILSSTEALTVVYGDASEKTALETRSKADWDLKFFDISSTCSAGKYVELYPNGAAVGSSCANIGFGAGESPHSAAAYEFTGNSKWRVQLYQAKNCGFPNGVYYAQGAAVKGAGECVSSTVFPKAPKKFLSFQVVKA